MNTDTQTGGVATSDSRPVFRPKSRLQDQNFTRSTTGGLLDLSSILSAAYAGAGVEAPQPPAEKSAWAHSMEGGQHVLEWRHGVFGWLKIQIGNGLVLGKPEQRGSISVARAYGIGGNPTPSYVPLSFKAGLKKNRAGKFSLLDARAGVVTDVTDNAIEPLMVDIEWDRRNNPPVPHSRVKNKDNLDFVFMADSGMFIQIQVSVVTRGGRIWICIQEIYSGQVVRTTHAKARELELTNLHVGSHAGLIAPLYAENAFAGSDYLKTFPMMGPKIVEKMIADGAVVALSECRVAKWLPPQELVLDDKMRANGWQVATVTFFNLVTGYGFAICKDGTSCFIHFKSIVDKEGRQVWTRNEFPALLPMTEFAVKYKEEGGKRSATAIRVFHKKKDDKGAESFVEAY